MERKRVPVGCPEWSRTKHAAVAVTHRDMMRSTRWSTSTPFQGQPCCIVATRVARRGTARCSAMRRKARRCGGGGGVSWETSCHLDKSQPLWHFVVSPYLRCKCECVIPARPWRQTANLIIRTMPCCLYAYYRHALRECQCVPSDKRLTSASVFPSDLHILCPPLDFPVH